MSPGAFDPGRADRQCRASLGRAWPGGHRGPVRRRDDHAPVPPPPDIRREISFSLLAASCRVHSIVVREPARVRTSTITNLKEKSHHEVKLKTNPKHHFEIQNRSRDCVVDFADSDRL